MPDNARQLTQTEQLIISHIKEQNTAQLTILYSIARYHEKYIFAKHALDELVNKGFTNEDIANFDAGFSHLYDALLNSPNL